MSEPTAADSLRYAGKMARQLLFPFGFKKWLGAYLGLNGLTGNKADPLIVELRRLQNYYRGTSLLAKAGLLFVVLGFFLPFTVVFVGLEGFFVLLAGYIVAMLLLSLAGIVLEVVLDPIFALRYEDKVSFRKAAGEFFTLLGRKTGLIGGYMLIKLIIDMFLVTAVLAMFIPALISAMAVMLYVIDAVQAGVDVRSTATWGLSGVLVLGLLGFTATILITIVASAFYGYYTEHAVRLIRA
ncbi:hypothetical protein [Methanocella arvoryzae]|uniref:Uncharacterized protein n=1 Tax=Methanocella arvoryzae (strain DSM 22066 / NBRC 105507 / MRE50) TaxID=351160 RepID=Q0W356_METAR|nr:hypothetical protein [Methanocella arvoryzae]CAJ37187.1 hypothetical protein RCIX2042 [Methanocella arvoryzae MRE50]